MPPRFDDHSFNSPERLFRELPQMRVEFGDRTITYRQLMNHVPDCRLVNCSFHDEEICDSLKIGFEHFEDCMDRRLNRCYICLFLEQALILHMAHCSDRANCVVPSCRHGFEVFL
uniref:TAZ-type domain-containing protein n=1 Tax=Steinernema glaseri TaxID=37863 RepID=A0A1I8A8U8_9BILA